MEKKKYRFKRCTLVSSSVHIIWPCLSIITVDFIYALKKGETLAVKAKRIGVKIDQRIYINMRC